MKYIFYIINRAILIIVLVGLYINPLNRNFNMKYLSIVFLSAALIGGFSQFITYKSLRINKRLIILYSLYFISFLLIGYIIVSYILNVSFLFC